jgi:hypothetical protein
VRTSASEGGRLLGVVGEAPAMKWREESWVYARAVWYLKQRGDVKRGVGEQGLQLGHVAAEGGGGGRSR